MAFPIQFLIDECVSPNLASEARRRGFAAWHVNHRKLARTPDPAIFRTCLAEDLVLVTNNASDFRRLYASAEAHPGLIIILPVVSREEQERLFALALDWTETQRDLINMLVEVSIDGTVSASIYP